MTATQCGYYINLLAHAWLGERPGYIPNDPDLIWKLARAKSKKEFEREAAPVMAQFSTAYGGKLLGNRRLIQEMRVMVLKRREKVVAGTAGANSRWKNKIHGTAIVSPMANDSSSSSISSSTSTAQVKSRPQNLRACSPPISEREQRRRIEAKTLREQKEAEAQREIHIGIGPSTTAFHLLAKGKSLQ
jgi:uncharacterized protein YdaU (DUF1376 family)